MIGDENAQHERTEVALESDEFEQLRTAQSKQETIEDHELAMADALERDDQQWPKRKDEQDQQGPVGRPLPHRDGQKDNGSQVLDDENSDCDPAVERCRLALVFQHLHDEHRAGEAQGKGDQKRLEQVEVGKERRPECGGKIDGRCEKRHDDGHMQPGHGPYLRSGKHPKVELQADDEQQQGNAEVRQFPQHVPTGYSMQVEQESRNQETDQGWQPDGSRQQAQHERHGDPCHVSERYGDQLEVHGTIGGGGSGLAA